MAPGQPGLPAAEASPGAIEALPKFSLAGAEHTESGDSQRITASYYGSELAGSPTATGEPFDPNGMTAASKTLPLGTMVELQNPANGQVATVRINDRGPYVDGRDLDCSEGAARALGFEGAGTAQLDMKVVGQ